MVVGYFLSLLIFWPLVSFADESAGMGLKSLGTKKNSVEDLFIWKVSDELKLSAQEEKKFSEIHRNLNKRKSELSLALEKLSFERQKNASLTKAQINQTLKSYKSTLIEYNKLSVTEFEQMKKLLGESKFLDYLALKQDITAKLKLLVLGSDKKSESSSESKTLPPPQVIEEK